MTAGKNPKGLFLNHFQSQCSIYESGRMFYQSLLISNRYQLDYQEINREHHHISNQYDFYLFNYHYGTMNWLDTTCLRKLLPGVKMTIVLETAPNDPFALCSFEDFDVYCVLEPSMNVPDKRVYPFPRPLEIVPDLPPYQDSGIPLIGSFGFATPGKGFELVVDAVNKEFEKAIIRINIPSSTYSDGLTSKYQNRNYAQYLSDLCKKVAKRGVEVVVTHDYLTKEELIKWCGQNTLNCFLYNRIQPGLSATADQAISSGRPLAVSGNETFRHIHAYIEPYPFRSLTESIERSSGEVLKMRQDWSPQESAGKFEKILEDHHLLPKEPAMGEKGVKSQGRRIGPVLFVSHKEKQCGIYQYGVNLNEVFSESSRFHFVYEECSSAEELRRLVFKLNPAAIIYNYYPATMGWLTKEITRRHSILQLGIKHEVTQEESDRATQEMFDYHLCPDPTLEVRNPYVIKTKRLIPPYMNLQSLPSGITIGSFGFGFNDKGFERLVETVQNEFDRAKIIIQMPFNDVVDKKGEQHALETAKRCRAAVMKPGIELEIRHDFLTRKELLDFLAGNTLNAFFYDTHKNRGISSVIEHALAVQRPIAITKSGMFRHVVRTTPSICIEDSSLKQIAENGIVPLVPFYNEWSKEAFLIDYERIIDNLLNPGMEASRIERGSGIEKIAGKAEKNSQSTESIQAEALLVDPSDPGMLHDLGIVSFQRGDLELAADCFLKALAVKPDFPAAHNYLGVVFNEMGRRDEAKVYYEMAIALKPDYAEPYHNLGVLLKSRGGIQEALSYVKKAVELKPDYAEAKRNLEEIEILLGERKA